MLFHIVSGVQIGRWGREGVKRSDKKQMEGLLKMGPYHRITQRIYDSVEL